MGYFQHGIFYIVFFLPFLVSCGNRFDLDTEYGRNARIYKANQALSHGHCQDAKETITPLYDSKYVNDEIRIIKASTHACFAGFHFIELIENIGDASGSIFQALSKTMPSGTASDGISRLQHMYYAIDVLTEDGEKKMAVQRSPDINTMMMLVQFAMVGSNISRNGQASADGVKGRVLVYNLVIPSNSTLNNEDACAIGAAFGVIIDSFANSGLGGEIQTAVDTLIEVCDDAASTFIPPPGSGIEAPDCSNIHKSRDVCTGELLDPPSQHSAVLIFTLNLAWQ